SVRSIEGERGRVGEWVSGRVVEWVRDTKRSQTQSVSPRKTPPLARSEARRILSVRSIEGERGRVGEWVSGRVVEWVRDTKRSQTQSVSPRKPPPLAGHTLPVV